MLNQEHLARKKAARNSRNKNELPNSLAPVSVTVLMLVDDRISFSPHDFGLSTVIDYFTLATPHQADVKFIKAHRQEDLYKIGEEDQELYERYKPDFENFRFTQEGFDMDTIDQVWFFAFNGYDNAPEGGKLDDEELRILAEWMDNGGGVFATGDHLDLGEALCARIPRVKSMRKWSLSQDPPSMSDEYRHDTNRSLNGDPIEFNNQSDDVPQPLRLKWYIVKEGPAKREAVPHAILSGTAGPIDIFPDHPHEGEVIHESDIDLENEVTDIPGYTGDEYPMREDGLRESPEVIAWCSIDGESPRTGTKGEVIAKEFPGLGVYDGHRANIGRLVVDSTWHHWFDVNLVGDEGLPEPFDQGFLASNEGIDYLFRICNYFDNVALWLGSREVQKANAISAVWEAALLLPITQKFPLDTPILTMGKKMRLLLSELQPEAMVRDWITLPFSSLDDAQYQLLQKAASTSIFGGTTRDLLEVSLLGGITLEFMAYYYKEVKNVGGKADESAIASAYCEGLRKGAAEFQKQMAVELEEMKGLNRSMESMLSVQLSPESFKR